MAASSSGLKRRERRFVEEYLVDLNATRAAVRAGYSEKTATSIACRLMKKEAIGAAVRAGMDERSKRTQITADRVLRELARIAFADIRSFTERDGSALTAKSLAALSDDDSAAIAEMSGTDGKTFKVKLHDKKHALDKIARHLGLYGKRATAAESPAAAAQRAREFILSRLAQRERARSSG